MAALPDNQNSTVQAIYRLHEAWESAQSPRGHLGASIIGRACERALWYEFRHAAPKNFGGRLLRLFESGRREEARLIAELRAIGCEVWESDPETGKQISWTDCDGHFAGSCDGIVLGLPEAPKTAHVFEAKTHNAKSFADLRQKGVKESKPEHWTQMQTYMGWSGLERAVYVAVCKDTDDIYLERIEADPLAFVEIRAKAARIIRAAEPPARISEDPSWWICKLCDFHAICHGEAAPAKNCRTCCYASPVNDARWHCARWQDAVPLDVQWQGCEAHLFIPPVLTFAAPVDATDDAVIYEHRTDGRRFVNGPTGTEIKDEQGEFLPVYPSDELAGMPASLVADPFVAACKVQMNATVEHARRAA